MAASKACKRKDANCSVRVQSDSSLASGIAPAVVHSPGLALKSSSVYCSWGILKVDTARRHCGFPPGLGASLKRQATLETQELRVAPATLFTTTKSWFRPDAGILKPAANNS